MALYRDFNLSFSPDPITRDLARVEDEAAVKQSVKHIVLTKLFDRVFQPELGSELYRTLFEPLDQVTCAVLARSIADAIRLFEPRVKLLGVDLHFDKTPNGEVLPEHSLYVELIFQIKNFSTTSTTGVVLRRLR